MAAAGVGASPVSQQPAQKERAAVSGGLSLPLLCGVSPDTKAVDDGMVLALRLKHLDAPLGDEAAVFRLHCSQLGGGVYGRRVRQIQNLDLRMGLGVRIANLALEKNEAPGAEEAAAELEAGEMVGKEVMEAAGAADKRSPAPSSKVRVQGNLALGAGGLDGVEVDATLPQAQRAELQHEVVLAVGGSEGFGRVCGGGGRRRAAAVGSAGGRGGGGQVVKAQAQARRRDVSGEGAGAARMGRCLRRGGGRKVVEAETGRLSKGRGVRAALHILPPDVVGRGRKRREWGRRGRRLAGGLDERESGERVGRGLGEELETVWWWGKLGSRGGGSGGWMEKAVGGGWAWRRRPDGSERS